MPLDRRVRLLVTIMNRLDRRRPDASIIDVRARSAALARRGKLLVMRNGPKAGSEVDHMVPVDGGNIRVRLHTPTGPGPWPLYVFIHGGGWCIGSLDERDPRCRAIAAGARCAVATIEYRMAPENAYPTPGEDCYAAVLWLVAEAERLGLDASRVAVGGESAGGNLAAVVCLMARDRSGPPICHQWLDVPALDLTLAQPSFQEVPDGYLLNRAEILEFRRLYLVDVNRDAEPYASPLMDPDLAGLPPAWIMSAEFDKLRDDGRAYADKLDKAGVSVTYRLMKGHVHPSFAFTRLIPAAKAYERDAIAALAEAFRN